jgi:hypothetical protein
MAATTSVLLTCFFLLAVLSSLSTTMANCGREMRYIILIFVKFLQIPWAVIIQQSLKMDQNLMVNFFILLEKNIQKFKKKILKRRL